ncbi:hypothetical protein MVEG_10252 [Podila verticillata NRRL 6337]|nr:MAG: hypothetical protein BYD32DRAFT_411732 [Podila humilis]KFH64427.1 hypothetical protein MVEG_10252 [Podila verticillata NRRL 6337]
MRQLTLLQRQKITLSLFFTVALGAVFTVAAPAFVPWQVVDNTRAQALDQQRRQGKDFHVVENHHRRRAGSSPTTTNEDVNGSPATPSTLSHQGMIIPLLTDRSRLQPSLGSEVEALGQGNESNSQQADGSTAEPTRKKRRRRRKRTMVNEGWQELTGRTAREEKEKHGAHLQHESEDQSRVAVGENGGKEISWEKQS